MDAVRQEALLERVLSGRSRDWVKDVLRLTKGPWRPEWARRLARAALTDRRERVRMAAVEALYLGEPPARYAPGAVEAFLPLIEEPGRPYGEVGRAAEALGPLVADLDGRSALARRAVRALGALLRHPNPDVRADAVYGLGQVRRASAIAWLRTAESDCGEFWGGRVGRYAKAWGADARARGREPLRFRYRNRRGKTHDPSGDAPPPRVLTSPRGRGRGGR